MGHRNGGAPPGRGALDFGRTSFDSLPSRDNRAPQRPGTLSRPRKALALALALALLLWTFGPRMTRRAGEGKPAGWPAWMPASFSTGQGRPVEKPRRPPANLPSNGRKA